MGDHQFDSLGLVKRKREIKAVNATGLDRDAGRDAFLPQPPDETAVPGRRVVEPALRDSPLAWILAGDIDPGLAHVGSGNGDCVCGRVLSVVHENKTS